MSKKDIKKVKNKNEEIKEEQEEKQEEIKNSEIELLGNRIKELEEKLVRNQAELINYKRRKDDEVSRMLKYSQEDIILEILPIIDNFERAIKLDDNNLEDELSKFLNGFKMTYTNLIEVLKKYEVKKGLIYRNRGYNCLIIVLLFFKWRSIYGYYSIFIRRRRRSNWFKTCV